MMHLFHRTRAVSYTHLTDLALAKAESWINQDNYENTHIVLITDGAP